MLLPGLARQAGGLRGQRHRCTWLLGRSSQGWAQGHWSRPAPGTPPRWLPLKATPQRAYTLSERGVPQPSRRTLSCRGWGCKAGPPTGTRRASPASRAPGPAPAGPASLPLRATSVSAPGRPSWRRVGEEGGPGEEGVTHRSSSSGCQVQLCSHSCVTWAGQATSLVLGCHFLKNLGWTRPSPPPGVCTSNPFGEVVTTMFGPRMAISEYICPQRPQSLYRPPHCRAAP